MDDEREVLKKYNDLMLEILQKGWNGILKEYHPEISDHPRAMDLFLLYKEIYIRMKNTVLIDIESHLKDKYKRGK